MINKQPLDPIAQLVAKYEANRQQSTSLPTTPPPKKSRLGFAGKTFWDWLNLLGVFLVPLMIGVFTVTITIQQGQISQNQHASDQTIAKNNRQKDIQIAEDQQREAVLETYMDDISNLLLHEGLRESQPDAEVRVIAQTKTGLALQRLDTTRKGILVQFLAQLHLINGNDVVISLSGVDLSGADLSRDNLSGAYLFQANLRGANLFQADLSQADLRRVNLRRANLSEADLSRADLRGIYLHKGYSRANLSEANLSEANLSWADLSRADLSQADLRRADLSYTDLARADLSQADLGRSLRYEADLHSADLSGAYLKDAKVTPSQLAQAKFLEYATLPDGSFYPSQSYPIPNHIEPTPTP